MTIRRTFNLPLVCLLIIGLLAGSARASSYVWCVSTDGDHSVLEFAPAGDCSRDDCLPASDSVAAAALDATADDCGPCLDISSSHQWNVSRSRQVDVAATPLDIAPDAVTARPSLPERSLATLRLVDRPPRVPAPLMHQRTVVLLI